jgi:hypothetical protein
VGFDEKNEAILNLDRQLREKTQKIEQVNNNFEDSIDNNSSFSFKLIFNE